MRNRLLKGASSAIVCLVLTVSTARAAQAPEPGNPPVFYVGSVGPYAVHVSIHPPDVIPGRATLQIESDDGDLQGIRLLALPLASEQAAFPPTPDRAERSASNPRQLVGQLWLMSSGSWQVRILADGARGPGELSIPVPALPTHVASMPVGLGALLLGLLLLLAAGVVSIVSAAVREGQLQPGQEPAIAQRRSGRMAATIAAGVVLALVFFGDRWWAASAGAYARSVYRPLQLAAQLESRFPGELQGNELRLTLEDPGWLPSRKLDDLIAPSSAGTPAGGPGPMDLWVVELPGFENVWHLHPEQLGAGQFKQALPAMPPARYALFARIVHANGLAESLRAEVNLPAMTGQPLGPADARELGGPLGTAEAQVAALPNGGRLELVPDRPPRAAEPTRLRLRVEDRQGKPEEGLESFGHLAEAAIVSSDLSTFTTVTTRGTVAPAAWTVANPGAQESAEAPSSELAFPCEFPRPGRYRVFIEVRRTGENEIAMLDVRVL